MFLCLTPHKKWAPKEQRESDSVNREQQKVLGDKIKNEVGGANIFTSSLHCVINVHYWHQLSSMEKTQFLLYYNLTDWTIQNSVQNLNVHSETEHLWTGLVFTYSNMGLIWFLALSSIRILSVRGKVENTKHQEMIFWMK